MWSTLNSVKQSTKANGFDTRLGKLMSTLKAQSAVDSGQIPTHVLRTHGIANIDRRRRSEALWFYENQAECVEFIKQSRKGFTSLTALQAAMRKAAKANTAESSAKANAEGIQAMKDAGNAKASAEAAEVSKVGQLNGKDTLVSDTGWQEVSTAKVSVGPITRTKMVETIVKQCEFNGLDLETIIDDLMSRLASQQKSA
jgi:hypothetical protein